MKQIGMMSSSDTDRNIREELIDRDRRRRKRRIRIIILMCLALIPMFTYLETKMFQVGKVPFPVSGNVLVFVLININVLLLLLMVFLVLRNLVQLVFERRRKFLGTKLRTKLVISFVSLSLIPTTLLFFIALQFVSTSMDYWFNINVEQSLEESLNVAKNVYRDVQKDVLRQGNSIGARLQPRLRRALPSEKLEPVLATMLESHDLAGLELFSDQRVAIGKSYNLQGSDQQPPEISQELLRRSLNGEEDLVSIQPIAGGELVRGFVPLTLESGENKYVLVVSRVLSRDWLDRMAVVSKGLEGYRQLMLLKNPIKTSLLVILLIVTLLIVFCAIWFGFYVANGLTVPIGKLAEATRRVAEGKLDFFVEKTSGDEMGTLVESFNRMTQDLRMSRKEVESANLALRKSNLELDKRRRYTETILQNVAAGVISMDENGRVTTMNRFAEELLEIDREKIIGKDYSAILKPNHLSILEDFLADLFRSGKSSIQRPLRLTIRDETFFLRVNLTKMEDEFGNPLGIVLVFDNLTELEKAQRMAAWREVARRIAHEVKNPLTPIQLSAQRLRKKYLGRLDREEEVFDLCTTTIIKQVDELKKLVSEFSSFARMPTIQKTMSSLANMTREVLSLYQEAHKQIAFHFQESKAVPDFYFDLTQIKRVLVNLLDNAVAVLPQGGVVDVEVSCDTEQKLAYFEVRDSGPGVRDEDKIRLFEPYFSTKKTGTGLGLAIASTIVTDHGGSIRIKDNEPSGARFIVELPLLAELDSPIQN